MKRILVAVDSSPRATAVLDAGNQLAAQTGATLIVYRAVGVPPDLPLDLLTKTDLRVEEVLMRNAYSDLARLTKEIPAARIAKHLAVFATPWDGICRAAREENADLIVIGSHGHGRLDRLLGTTAAKIVNHTDRNVLVVREPL